MSQEKLTNKDVAENAIITLGIALKAIQQSGSHIRIIQDIKNQIAEIREHFKV
jgi:hypothetical protein